MYQQQNQQTALASPATSAMPTTGWLPRIKHWLVGRRDPIEAQLREVERQGRGMARLMHAAGYLMLILFSAGSAIGICGTLVERVIANGPLTWQSMPNDIVITVSLMLVFCMDLAAIYAAFHMRLLATRHAPWKQYVLHVGVLVICTALEGGTFIQMSFAYDNVVAATVALLIIARGVVAPLLSVYLNMARPIPVGVADLMYHSFVGSAQGLAHDMIHIANDPASSLAEKAELVSASAQVNAREQAQLSHLIEVARQREARSVPALPAGHSGVPSVKIHAAATLPETEPQAHYSAQSMHDWDEIPDELEEGSDLYSTMEIPTPSRPLVDSTPVASSGGRRRINTGLADGMGNDFALDGDDDDADYPSHSAHQRKKGKSSSGHRNQRQYKAQRATEVQATRERGRAIDMATNAVFAEVLETGDDPSDYDLVERVNEHLERMGSSVRTSRTAVRKRKADWLAQMGLNSAMDRNERELQEVW